MTDTAIAEPQAAQAPDLGFRLNFFKLVVADMAAMVEFYQTAFGMTEGGPRIDLPDLEEAMLTMPGERFTLVLYRWKDGRALDLGNAYGPVGFLTKDIDAAQAKLIATGARPLRGPFALGPMKIAFLADPEGHELELVQYVRA